MKKIKRTSREQGDINHILSLPRPYPDICLLDNALHPKQLHPHGKAHSQKKPFQHCMQTKVII